MNYAIKLSYSGTNFSGWQIQNNVPTIQGAVEKAVKKLFGNDFTVYGCSRTDAGVHALEYVCMIKLAPDFDPTRMPLALNTYLPEDIAVLDVAVVDDSFHPRFCALKKEYIYKVYSSRIRDPFLNNRAYMYKRPLDEIKCNELAKEFVGTFDFSSFMASGSSITDTVRTIYSFDVYSEGNTIVFKVCGNGFLYNMVRIIVGTLIEVAFGRFSPYDIKNIIESRDRTKAGMTAPPEGLYLNRVTY